MTKNKLKKTTMKNLKKPKKETPTIKCVYTFSEKEQVEYKEIFRPAGLPEVIFKYKGKKLKRIQPEKERKFWDGVKENIEKLNAKENEEERKNEMIKYIIKKR